MRSTLHILSTATTKFATIEIANSVGRSHILFARRDLYVHGPYTYPYESSNLHCSFIQVIGISSHLLLSQPLSHHGAPPPKSTSTRHSLTDDTPSSASEMLHIRQSCVYIENAFICLSISEKLSKNKRGIGPNLLFCSQSPSYLNSICGPQIHPCEYKYSLE